MDMHKWLSGTGAAGVTFLLQLAEQGRGLPGCTGTCGACGGSCFFALGAAGWLGILALRQRGKKKELEHG